MVDHLYDKIEKGEIYSDVKLLLKEETEKEKTEKHENNNIINLKKMGNIVTLVGEDNNVKLNIDDYINDDKHSRRSDSSNSLMDFDVICNKENDSD